MRIEREKLIPTNAPLVGFGGTRVYPLDVVTLPITVGDYPKILLRMLHSFSSIVHLLTMSYWAILPSIRGRP